MGVLFYFDEKKDNFIYCASSLDSQLKQKIMLVGCSEQDLQEWRNNMQGYEKDKRTKKPFGKQHKCSTDRVTEAKVKEEQRQFDPILQKYEKAKREEEARRKQDSMRNSELLKYLKFAKKNEREFDIVNLHGSETMKSTHQMSLNSKVKAPIRNAYNPINNQALPDFYYKNRDLRLPRHYNFKKISPEQRDFNIVTGDYCEENEQKLARDQREKEKKILEKLNKTRSFNPVFSRYYDSSKQEEYDKQLEKSGMMHGSHFDDRLPPTYKNREPLTLDREKPPTQSLIALDKKNADAKQRFQMKYILEEEYARRNIEHQERKESQLKNRVHNSHILQMKAKEFDIVNMSAIEPRRAENLFGKQAVESTWEQLNPQRNTFGGSHRRQSSEIKSSGFR